MHLNWWSKDWRSILFQKHQFWCTHSWNQPRKRKTFKRTINNFRSLTLEILFCFPLLKKLIEDIDQVKFFSIYRLRFNNLLFIILIFNFCNGLKFICKIAFAVFQIRIKITLPSNLFFLVFFQIFWTSITLIDMCKLLDLFWLHIGDI